MNNMSDSLITRLSRMFLTLAKAYLAVCVSSAADSGEVDKPIVTGPRAISWRDEGQTIWVNGPDGRQKVRAYPGTQLSDNPVLMLWIHGDLDPGAEPGVEEPIPCPRGDCPRPLGWGRDHCGPFGPASAGH